MSGKEPEFGTFGTIKPLGRIRRKTMRLFRWVWVIGILVLVPYAWHGWSNFYTNLAERDPPLVKIIHPPVGVGSEPATIEVRVDDAQSGIDEVIIRTEQGGQTKTLLTKSYPERITTDTLRVEIDPKELGFREGNAKVHITAFDRSFWSSSYKASLDLVVDYRAPAIAVISTQHNAVRSGVELVFYRLSDDPQALSGVVAGSTLFPGFPAKKLDADFEVTPDVYFSLFAIPREFREKEDGLRLFARDVVGNSSGGSMFYRVAENMRAVRKVEVTRELLERSVDPLYQKYLQTKASLEGRPVGEYFPSIRDEERIERFVAVNGDYRAIVESALKEIFERPKQQRYWREPFLRQSGQRLNARAGEIVNYSYQGTTLGSFDHEGVFFKLAEGAEVRAANAGIVIFADDLGPYGTTLVIDHGFGLSTLYSHVKDLKPREGDRVSRGEVVAKVGRTGLVEQPGVLFQTRLHGVPVRADEWFDGTWITAHITDKIQSTKGKLGLQVRSVLE